ncbi:hypothetical protein [Kibdelosporangium phytohabitans]|uniref:Uncharacterized protein n=1 Tax=Kibdelosporangium phytohabitans TaxID=860235 RepID=A0A0N9HZK2_9PSEU|nr:hypothetical protein [Kibdelosporangium phytohabitans]ALG07627.1 hypothetical protein AOZ06_12565 [Kibdelosporangium phytohabitans]ALG07683.1 hypothetical protein AOZ06_12885 [Kibdelosporangium phytohabitans]MBE1471422.1 hypothetical protein [Kibdelosporangium phytohabitans]
MTDLLGLLTHLHAAVTGVGAVHIVPTTPGMPGAVIVDQDTATIHIDVTLPIDQWFAGLADGLRELSSRGDPGFGMEAFGDGESVTADGARIYPMWPRLRLVGDT